MNSNRTSPSRRLVHAVSRTTQSEYLPTCRVFWSGKFGPLCSRQNPVRASQHILKKVTAAKATTTTTTQITARPCHKVTQHAATSLSLCWRSLGSLQTFLMPSERTPTDLQHPPHCTRCYAAHPGGLQGCHPFRFLPNQARARGWDSQFSHRYLSPTHSQPLSPRPASGFSGAFCQLQSTPRETNRPYKNAHKHTHTYRDCSGRHFR